MSVQSIFDFDIEHGRYMATFEDYYDGAPDSGTQYQLGIGKTKREAVEDLFQFVDEKTAPKSLLDIWEDWLRDDHDLHQDDDRDELWENFCEWVVEKVEG